MNMLSVVLVLSLLCVQIVTGLLPPKFQWKTIDFAWQNNEREGAIASGSYIPENNMPSGLARWRDKLFITIPRWKKGVPSSLNYVSLNGSQNQHLTPYPSWNDAFVSDKKCCISSNSTVVSTFKVCVDRCDRLWVVDNGVSDMSKDVNQIADPAIVVFDLNTDTLLFRYVLPEDVLRDSSVLSSIVVDVVGKECDDAYAYIPDMGSSAIIVYSLRDNDAWRVENHYFHFDPHAGIYNVGGIEFYWRDGVSSAALSHSTSKKGGYRDLYLHPTSSTKQFKMSTRLLRDKNIPPEEIFNGVEIVGDRGPNTQATACDFDPKNNVLFTTQLNKNGVSCWNIDKPFNDENNALIISDCNILEFPNDIKVDQEGNLWILSDKQSRFLYDALDFKQTNYRVLTAPVTSFIKGTPCEKLGSLKKALSFIKRPKSKEHVK